MNTKKLVVISVTGTIVTVLLEKAGFFDWAVGQLKGWN